MMQSLWNWLVGGIWKSLEKQAKERPECCKQSITDESGEDTEDQNAGRHMNSKCSARQVSDGNRDYWGLDSGHSCYVRQRNRIPFVYALRLCGRLSSKVMTSFSPRGNFKAAQNSRYGLGTAGCFLPELQ
jgi:hypothetical protein